MIGKDGNNCRRLMNFSDWIRSFKGVQKTIEIKDSNVNLGKKSLNLAHLNLCWVNTDFSGRFLGSNWGQALISWCKVSCACEFIQLFCVLINQRQAHIWFRPHYKLNNSIIFVKKLHSAVTETDVFDKT
jgi:hypothetical protein